METIHIKGVEYFRVFSLASIYISINITDVTECIRNLSIGSIVFQFLTMDRNSRSALNSRFPFLIPHVNSEIVLFN